MFSRGDVDGGFGAVFAPPFGPGFIPFPSETADGIPDLDQITQEVRVASNDDDARFGWLVGGFFFDEDLRVETFSFNSLAGNVQDGFAFQEQEARSWALFGSADYDVTERLNVQAGVRFTTDDKDFVAERPDPTFNTPTVAPIDDEVGSLEPGKRGDVVVWSGDPFSVYSRAEVVYVDGARVFDLSDPELRPATDFELGTPAEEVIR